MDDAVQVFAQVRAEAARRSPTALLVVCLRELWALAMTAHAERRARVRGAQGRPAIRPPGERLRPCSFTLARSALAESTMRDLRDAARQLVRAPMATLVAAGSVGTALAGVVVVFALGNSLLWRPLPIVAAPDRLVRVFFGEGSGVWSYPHFDLVTRDRRTLDAAAFTDSPVAVGGVGAEPRATVGVSASVNIFDVLGVSPVIGRTFTDEDGDAVVLVGYGYWMRELGGRPGAIGETLLVGGRDLTIIGVLPEGVSAISAPVEPRSGHPIPRALRLTPSTGRSGSSHDSRPARRCHKRRPRSTR